MARLIHVADALRLDLLIERHTITCPRCGDERECQELIGLHRALDAVDEQLSRLDRIDPARRETLDRRLGAERRAL
ncbi:hypothetical protein GCM10009681_56810 [Luedemannella helvata]|uniref:Uncharacterized protein n=1 Tax=Luedemannella helvata TaxID=349315 RepID=A0ABP4XEP3_9ACTN